MIYSLMETVWSTSTKNGNSWSFTLSSVESLSESMVKANPLNEGLARIDKKRDKKS